MLYVMLGGVVGALSRFTLMQFLTNTMMLWVVNVTGSFLLGYFNGYFIRKPNAKWQLFITTGMLGAFTTFSTFSATWFALIDTAFIKALLYAFCMTGSCMVLAFFGYKMGRAT